MPLDSKQLLRKPPAELDQLFRTSPVGRSPDGEGVGTAIVCSGSLFACLAAWFVRWFCWQGKVFNRGGETLVNLISPFSFKVIKAKIYRTKSWLDDRECIVLDYSKTSLVARCIRDEIREVAPGLYLGQVFIGRRRIFRFTLSFQYQPSGKRWRRVLAGVAGLVAVFAVCMAIRITSDMPVVYANAEAHFKYGSTGGERASGIPLSVWKVLPVVFRQYLPANYDPLRPYAAFGFVYEQGKDLAIGVSQRRVQGLDRVFLNCAICHVGTVRDTAESPSRVVVGMPANVVDLQAFERFLFNCAVDENFTAARLVPEIARCAPEEDSINRLILQLIGISLMRDQIITLRDRFKFQDREPDCGPGRVDTFNPPKVLLNFRMENIPTNEWVGNCDLPSVWNQAKRVGMFLHWDGNNDSIDERNRSAAFGTGALPPTLDRLSLTRMKDFLMTNSPPKWPYPIDDAKAGRGAAIYAAYCAGCHGKNGSDFSGEWVGKVTPIERIRTDRHRLDSYTEVLCVNQNLLYAAYPDERFKHFHKTFGYANQPLDGLWLRGPYLHNGSVPTVRELLEPVRSRRPLFYRGCDIIDRADIGFVADKREENGRKYFEYDTKRPGNGNQGHEGREYGTELSAEEKDTLVEFLKTF